MGRGEYLGWGGLSLWGDLGRAAPFGEGVWECSLILGGMLGGQPQLDGGMLGKGKGEP